ncbi:hypothetical protein [Glaciecola sp. KUL10]|uniref:hypothetical protein n=1 Tax=Glaciecola sp. (strain KUL10) TaxID=2161813 RepID=UPI000D788AF7|nr:hypothetical protein [Glaciecola sp. KUL10]GBL04302.1 hypothetical protein KUL10_16080 [Glaciecola sp. KUL10]
MMIKLGIFTISSTLPTWALVLLIVSLVALNVFLFNQVKQRVETKLKHYALSTLNALASLAIVGLLLDITYNVHKNDKAVIVTSAVANKKLREIDNSSSVYALQNRLQTSASQIDLVDLVDLVDYQTVSDFVSFTKHTFFDYKTIEILGDGLNAEQWQIIHALARTNDAKSNGRNAPQLIFTPNPNQFGLVDVNWQQQSTVGETVTISGQVQAASSTSENADDTTKLFSLTLTDPSGRIIAEEVVRIAEPFALNFIPIAAGQWEYSLQLKQANATKKSNKLRENVTLNEAHKDALSITETIAINVIDKPRLKLLISQSAPSFETKQIQNWAAENGAQIASFTQISRDKISRQFINFSDDEKVIFTSPLSSQSLNYIDLIIIDSTTLFKLSDEQHTSITEAVEQGLGIYLIVNYEDAQNWSTQSAEIESSKIANFLAINSLFELDYLENQDELRLINWGESSFDRPLAVIPASINNTLPSLFTKSLIQDQAGNSIIERIQLGKGKVALSLLPSSYAIKTQGSSLVHSQLWQFLIKNIAREKEANKRIYNAEPHALENIFRAKQPSKICKKATIENTQTDDTASLLLKQNGISREISFQNANFKKHINEYASTLCTKSLIDSSGWFSLHTVPSVNDFFNGFAYAHEDWLTNHTYALKRLNELQSSQFNKSRENIAYISRQTTRSIDKLAFWLLLLSSLTLIWIERVLNRR